MYRKGVDVLMLNMINDGMSVVDSDSMVDPTEWSSPPWIGIKK